MFFSEQKSQFHTNNFAAEKYRKYRYYRYFFFDIDIRYFFNIATAYVFTMATSNTVPRMHKTTKPCF